ncbi:MAG TPA: tetratricopeptide repeat protein [Candidatus Sericytochromatia bacterium]
MLRVNEKTDRAYTDSFPTELTPQDPRAYYNLGVALKGREQFKEAIAVVEKARDLYRKKGESEGEKKAESLLQELKKSDR